MSDRLVRRCDGELHRVRPGHKPRVEFKFPAVMKDFDRPRFWVNQNNRGWRGRPASHAGDLAAVLAQTAEVAERRVSPPADRLSLSLAPPGRCGLSRLSSRRRQSAHPAGTHSWTSPTTTAEW